ncbi:hypothetical protein HU200_043307 [Digitaria exilis]|uniref:Uncharacterized protein n=1 Tax=Digitaria exilis TaxID=1010633 RepID=A0A835B676_9POAL|nr:hypothetical protein HU200_043307 [Digitaria exilis]
MGVDLGPGFIPPKTKGSSVPMLSAASPSELVVPISESSKQSNLCCIRLFSFRLCCSFLGLFGSWILWLCV